MTLATVRAHRRRLYGKIARSYHPRSPMRSSGSVAHSLACVLITAALAAGGASALADELKIGFVSAERILRDSAPAKAAEQKLSQEFAKRGKDLQDMDSKLKAAADKLDKDSPVLSDADRSRRQHELQDMDREFQRKRREFQEDLNQRKNEEFQALLERAQRIVRQIAEQDKYDLILQDALYVGPRVDVTDRVLHALDNPK
jgi:outer membrane protein